MRWAPSRSFFRRGVFLEEQLHTVTPCRRTGKRLPVCPHPFLRHAGLHHLAGVPPPDESKVAENLRLLIERVRRPRDSPDELQKAGDFVEDEGRWDRLQREQRAKATQNGQVLLARLEVRGD